MAFQWQRPTELFQNSPRLARLKRHAVNVQLSAKPSHYDERAADRLVRPPIRGPSRLIYHCQPTVADAPAPQPALHRIGEEYRYDQDYLPYSASRWSSCSTKARKMTGTLVVLPCSALHPLTSPNNLPRLATSHTSNLMTGHASTTPPGAAGESSHTNIADRGP